MFSKPQPEEYSTFYKTYVDAVAETEGILALEATGKNLLFYLRSLPDTRGTYAYAAGKWCINDVVQHVIDGEIIFTYRALRIARGDKTPLPGFEQDDYVIEAQAAYKSLTELTDLFAQTRALTISIFKSFNYATETNTGIANGHEISLRALAFIIAGHSQHHHNILKERYF